MQAGCMHPGAGAVAACVQVATSARCYVHGVELQYEVAKMQQGGSAGSHVDACKGSEGAKLGCRFSSIRAAPVDGCLDQLEL